MTSEGENKVISALKGKTLFITGATGFLGQPLVEKILRVAPDIKQLCLLIRPKKQLNGQVMSPDERLTRELFKSSVFDHLRSLRGQETAVFLRDKLTAVPGDTSQPRLGIDDETHDQLSREVDIVINGAAVVSFDAPLDDALELNTLSAVRVAEFANSCEGALLVHVSTAFVSGPAKKVAPETLYHAATGEEASQPYPFGKFSDIDQEIEHLNEIINQTHTEAHGAQIDRQLKKALLKRFRNSHRGGRKSRRREKIENLRQKWITSRLAQEGLSWARGRGWNDTYTYTKAMGEQMIVRNRPSTVSTVIVRPSVIEGSLAEPSPGWLDGLRMADPLIVAIGKGRLRSLPMDPNITIDLVPVDMVVNALLAAIPSALQECGTKVYHVATGSTNPITLGAVYELVYSYFLKNPMVDKAGRPIQVKRVKFLHPKRFRLQHMLKTGPLGTAERVLGRLPAHNATQRVRHKITAARVAYEKLYYYGAIYEPYLNQACRFETDNTAQLFDSLSEEEKQVFSFDVRRLNWRHYLQNVHIPGVRKHILKQEEPATAPEQEALAPETIPQLLEATAARLPHKTALQIKREGQWRRFTYREVQQISQTTAAAFGGMGLEKGDRVILFSENQPEWGLAYLAAASAGLVTVPLDAQTWEKEVWAVARYTEAKALLVSEHCFEKLQSSNLQKNEESSLPLKILNLNQFCTPFEKKEYPRSTFVDIHTASRSRPPIYATDPVSIIFTTGTAVDPKGAVHDHGNFLKNLLGVNCYLPIQENDQILSVLPLYHALEFTCGFLMPIYGGATVTYLHSLKPKVILETMREVGATCMLGVPTLYALIRDDVERRVMRAAKPSLKSNLLSTSKQLSKSVKRNWGKDIGRQLFTRVHKEFGNQIRFFVSGGSALGEELYEDFQALGLPVYEGYGLTETAPVLTVNPLGQSRKGSAGKPLPGVELRLFRPDDKGVGEIIVQPPSLMQGYYGNPKATAAVTREGWFHTGDLGWIDAEGYLYITGRIKDVIVTGAGKNVYPSDLEAIYESLPSVKEVCVLGVKSDLTEDIHAVFVARQNDLEPQDMGAARRTIQREIQELAKDLPSYHRLQHVYVWEKPLPRKDSGVLRRSDIRERLLQQIHDEQPEPSADVRMPAAEKGDHEKALLVELSRLSGVPKGEIAKNSHLYADLGLDSLMAIELLLYIEHEFGVAVPDEAATKLQTVGQLLGEVASRQAASSRAPAALVASPRKIRSAEPYSSRRASERFLYTLALLAFRLWYGTYFALRVYGADRLPRNRPYIIAANHTSHLDAPAILSALARTRGLKEARKLHVLGARDYFFDTPLKSWLFSTFLNVVPVEREEASLATLRLAKGILAAAEPVLIFPEGTRSRTGQIQDFKPGLGLMALELDAPIVPAYIEGAHQALPAGGVMPRPGGLRVTFAPPITMEAYRTHKEKPSRDELYRQIAADAQRAVEGLASLTEGLRE